MDASIWACSAGKIGFCSMSSQSSNNDKLYSNLSTTTLWVNLKTIDDPMAFRLTGSPKEWLCRLRVASSVASNRFHVTCLIISKENFTGSPSVVLLQHLNHFSNQVPRTLLVDLLSSTNDQIIFATASTPEPSAKRH